MELDKKLVMIIVGVAVFFISWGVFNYYKNPPLEENNEGVQSVEVVKEPTPTPEVKE